MTERIPLSQSLAVQQFLETWGSKGDNGCGNWLAGDLGTQLTCIEAEALVDLFLAFGDEKAAEDWLSAHAEGDDEGDMHHPDYEEEE